MQFITPKFYPFYHFNFLTLFYQSRLYYCTNCNFGFLSNKLKLKKLNLFYKKSYWRWMGPDYKLDSYYDNRSHKHEQILRNLSATHVIDIGGGNDSFVKLFPDLVKILVEPSVIKLNDTSIILYKDILEIPVQIDSGFFRISHVLEHVIDIHGFLSKVHFLMGINSYLLIEVPDIENVDHFLREEHGPHTFMFSQNSLEKILTRHAFVTQSCLKENGVLVYLLSK